MDAASSEAGEVIDCFRAMGMARLVIRRWGYRLSCAGFFTAYELSTLLYRVCLSFSFTSSGEVLVWG